MRRLLSRKLSVVFSFLLLFAQFGALTHAAWHAHADIQTYVHSAAHDHGDAGHTHNDELPVSHHAELCAFDIAFGQVLGGVHACAALALPITGGEIAALDLPVSRLKAEALSPKSRGPPRLLL